jgi:hypothetical protein
MIGYSAVAKLSDMEVLGLCVVPITNLQALLRVTGGAVEVPFREEGMWSR